MMICPFRKGTEGVERLLFFTKSILRTIKTIRKMKDLTDIEDLVRSMCFVNETKDGKEALKGVLNAIKSLRKSKKPVKREEPCGDGCSNKACFGNGCQYPPHNID